jgi:ribosomal protein L29
MATKKTTKAAKQATEVKTIDQLKIDFTAAKTSLIEAKRGHRLGELTNPRVITVTRKKIARILTAIRAAEITELKEDK